MINSKTMDTPPPVETKNLLQWLSDNIGIVMGLLGFVAVLWGYVRYLHGKGKTAKQWFKDIVAVPRIVREIKAELEFEQGVSLRQKISLLGDNLVSLKSILMAETAARRFTMQAVSESMFEADKDGNWIWANDQLLELTGCELHQVIGNNWQNFVADKYRPLTIQAWDNAVAKKKDFRSRFMIDKPTSQFWAIGEAVCNKDELGNVLSYVGTITDRDAIHNTAS